MRHIHPIQPILVIVLAVVLWYLKRKPGEGPASAGGGKGPNARPAAQKVVKPQEPPEVVYMRLREQALETQRETLGLPGLPGEVKSDEVYGLLMEMEIAGSVVTLVCFASGDASIYYQSGGGMVGGISHDNVRKAAKEFISLGQNALSRMIRTGSQPLPGAGKIRFYALTPRGTLTTETDREAIGRPGNELSSLFYCGQEVVSQMREAQAQRAS